MTLINLKKVIRSEHLSQSFVVYRSTGQFVKGRWAETSVEEIDMKGIISVASSRELDSLPEGDRVSAAMVFHSTEPIYLTRAVDVVEETEGGVSDKILWRGEYYRVLKVDPYQDYGYFKATGVRMKGN